MFTDLDQHIELGSVNIHQVFSIMRSLNAVNLLDEELTTRFVDYIVKKGYDSDDLLEMGPPKQSHRRAIQLMGLISQTCKNLDNTHFFLHTSVFALHAYKHINPLQQQRLYHALSDFKHMKDDKVLATLRKAHLKNKMGAPKDEDEERRFGPLDPGYFTYDLEFTEDKRRAADDFEIDEEEFKRL